MLYRRILTGVGLVALMTMGPTVWASLIINSPTTDWNVVSYGLKSPDWYDDQQTGIGDSDIVGTNNLPAFYYAFDAGLPSSLTDGLLAFRLRLGDGGVSFPKVAHVGIDADNNGSVDVFVSADNSGTPDRLRIFAPGTDLNISPSTTSIDTQNPYASYVEEAANYDYSAVNATIDPVAFTYDADGDGNTDYFLSWSIPFQDLVNFLGTRGIIADENTALSFIAATSTQPNALNQDLNGPPKNYSGSSTWAQLGAASSPVSANGVIPEPHSLLLVLSGVVLLKLCRNRRGY
jgi:hypothetical protein